MAIANRPNVSEEINGSKLNNNNGKRDNITEKQVSKVIILMVVEAFNGR